MKRIILFIGSFLICLPLVFSANVSNPLEAVTLMVDDKIITISVNDAPDQKVRLSIMDAKGTYLHEETFNASKVKERKYSFEGLPVGEYIITIDDSQVRTMKTVKVQTDSINLISEDSIYKPMVFKKYGRINVNTLLLQKNATIKIIDQEGVVLYEEKIEGVNSYNKSFKILPNVSSVCTVQMIINGKNFYKSIEI